MATQLLCSSTLTAFASFTTGSSCALDLSGEAARQTQISVLRALTVGGLKGCSIDLSCPRRRFDQHPEHAVRHKTPYEHNRACIESSPGSTGHRGGLPSCDWGRHNHGVKHHVE
jgi:hypothetical protein